MKKLIILLLCISVILTSTIIVYAGDETYPYLLVKAKQTTIIEKN